MQDKTIEQLVLDAVKKGMMPKEAAQEYHYCHGTFRLAYPRVYKKFGVQNSCGLAFVLYNVAPTVSGKLTARQTELVGLLCLGGTTQDIADALGITPNVVKLVVHRIMMKFGVRTRLALVVCLLNPNNEA